MTIKPNFNFGSCCGNAATFVAPVWGEDNDNTIHLDNVRLVKVDCSAVPGLTITHSGGQAVINWASPAKLQSATSVNGPYTDVFDAVYNTYTVPASGSATYFRARAPLP